MKPIHSDGNRIEQNEFQNVTKINLMTDDVDDSTTSLTWFIVAGNQLEADDDIAQTTNP